MYVCVFVYEGICMCIFVCACICICISVCMCVCMHAYMYVCIYMYIYMYVYMYVYIYIYINLNSTTEKLTNCFRRKYLFHIMVKSLTRIAYWTMSSGDICSNVKLWMTSSCICCLGFLSFDSYI